MKKIMLVGLFLAAAVGTSQSLFYSTADGLGAGKISLTGAWALPAASVTELDARLSYGFTPDIDGYGRLALQSSAGSSSNWLGCGAKGLFQKASADLPLDLAWLGDFSYCHQNSLQTINLIGGIILSRKLDAKLTSYGVVGISYSNLSASLPIGGNSLSTSSGVVFGGGAVYAASERWNVKGEVLVSAVQGSSSTGAGLAGEYKF